ncbi:hypothetical protein MMC20_002513 [Loxospora ochrophaea]|nr:hypothetical protein [Loxospora ochrophaea]
MPLHVTEPHPSVPSSSSYIHSGRGGAGNVHRTPQPTTSPHSASGPASLIPLLPRHVDRAFTSGRGGAGNVHQGSERAIFSFDEELEHQRLHDSAPVYHIGRGGAGNSVDERTLTATGRRGSGSEGGSVVSGGSRVSDVSERARKSVEWVKDKIGGGGAGRRSSSSDEI